MAFNWPFFSRTVVCPDGTKRYVFRNIDRAFPFYCRQIKASTSAALEGIKDIKGNLGAQYEGEIKDILFSIDEKNGTTQAHFRAAYMRYHAEPCSGLVFLEKAIDAIRQDERDLRAAELAIRQLVVLLSTSQVGAMNDPA